MIRGLLLILDAGASWTKIAQKQRGFWFIFLVHLVPLMAMTLGVEAYALHRLGEGRTITDARIDHTWEEAVRYALTVAALNLGVILAGAKIVEHIGRSFHNASSYLPAFTLLAYGLSPLFLLHLLDALPGINTWICFGIGIALSIAALYLGIPTILKPDPAKAMGIYVIVSVLLLVLTGLAHFVAVQILHNELNPRFWEQLVR